MELAGNGKRFLALLIDAVILFVANKVIHALPIVGVIPGIMIVAAVCYFGFMESSKYAGTLGKIALAIEVRGQDGARVTRGAAFLRAGGKMVSVLVMFLGFLPAFFTGKRQTLHDMIARTIVVPAAPLPAAPASATPPDAPK
ncbi:RDD family protein [bacterium]|nr:RDD family protein [bacterium]